MTEGSESGDSTCAPFVGALVVTWNRREDVLECVRSILRSAYPRLAVYVVDNASSDGSGEAVASEFPGVCVIRSDENLGFAGGNNLGLARMLDDGVDAMFLVNDDAVVAEDTIDELLSGGFEDPAVGVLAPKVLVHADAGVIWSAGGQVDADTGITVQRHCGESDQGQADDPCEIDYAVGCAMLMKADVIRQAGLMDPRYFMYYEEVDWCRRIRRAGWRILYVPGSRVWHKVALDRDGDNRAAYYFSRNRLLYLSEAGVPAARIPWIAISDILRSAAAHAVKGRTDKSRSMVRGVADYCLKAFGRLGDD